MIDLFQLMGEPGNIDLVKTLKISLGSSNFIKTRSSLLFFLSPQCIEAIDTPEIL